MKRSRRNHSPAIKAKVALQAIRGDKTLAELAQQHQLHSTQIAAWKQQLLERANVVPDFRGPDAIRLGVAPLYTSHADVYDALERLRDLVERGDHRLVDAAPGRVT